VKPNKLHAPSCVLVGIPEKMIAGYDYSFKIQGRDEYHNNIADRLVDAVGTDNSIEYTLIGQNEATFNANVSDDSSPGVYLGRVSLPKKFLAG